MDDKADGKREGEERNKDEKKRFSFVNDAKNVDHEARAVQERYQDIG